MLDHLEKTGAASDSHPVRGSRVRARLYHAADPASKRRRAASAEAISGGAWHKVRLMSHPLVIALFDDPDVAGRAARGLRGIGVPADRVSIVAQTHDEEGALARAADASPGSEIEDSRPASRLGELGAHLIAAVALVMPGIGPIVADGPLAAGLGEAAGHLAGGISRALERAGLSSGEAEQWETLVGQGAVLIGAHATASTAADVQSYLTRAGASRVELCTWPGA
jgi:hypothetical protein